MQKFFRALAYIHPLVFLSFEGVLDVKTALIFFIIVLAIDIVATLKKTGLPILIMGSTATTMGIWALNIKPAIPLHEIFLYNLLFSFVLASVAAISAAHYHKKFQSKKKFHFLTTLAEFISNAVFVTCFSTVVLTAVYK